MSGNRSTGAGDEADDASGYLDPQCAALIAEFPPAAGGPTVAGARVGHQMMAERVTGPMPALAGIDGFCVPATADTPRLAVRRYRPAVAGGRAVVYLHGGGWVVGTLGTYDVLCATLAVALEAQVFSVDYRLSPEARFPAAIHDSLQAFEYIRARASDWNVDPTRLVLAGDSAGGHLAITVARWLAHGSRPGPKALVVVYPVTDRRLATPSASRFAEGHYLSRAMMDWYWRQFLGDNGPPATVPDVSPLLATDLGPLPPTFVLTAGCDPLRDEGEQFAARLREQGGVAEAERMPGAIHGFLRMGARLDCTARGFQAIAGALSRWRI